MPDQITILGKPGSYTILFNYQDYPSDTEHSDSTLEPADMVLMYQDLRPFSLVRYAGVSMP